METPAEMAEEELTSQAESSYSDFDVDDEKSSVPSALTSYFRRIHELPRQTVKSAEELRTGVIQAEDRFYNTFNGFGYVLKEHIRLLDNVLNGGASAGDLFMPSSVQLLGSNPSEIRESIGRWQKELSQHYRKWHALFSRRSVEKSGEELSALRLEAGELLGKYRLNSDYYADFLSALCELFMITPHEKLELSNPVLRAESEREFIEEKFLLDFSQIPDAVNGALSANLGLQAARNEMLEQNLRLVVTIAKSYFRSGVPVGDIIQEGNLGLLRAIEKFDFRLGYKFSTYAIWWIKQNINNPARNTHNPEAPATTKQRGLLTLLVREKLIKNIPYPEWRDMTVDQASKRISSVPPRLLQQAIERQNAPQRNVSPRQRTSMER